MRQNVSFSSLAHRIILKRHIRKYYICKNDIITALINNFKMKTSEVLWWNYENSVVCTTAFSALSKVESNNFYK